MTARFVITPESSMVGISAICPAAGLSSVPQILSVVAQLKLAVIRVEDVPVFSVMALKTGKQTGSSLTTKRVPMGTLFVVKEEVSGIMIVSATLKLAETF